MTLFWVLILLFCTCGGNAAGPWSQRRSQIYERDPKGIWRVKPFHGENLTPWTGRYSNERRKDLKKSAGSENKKISSASSWIQHSELAWKEAVPPSPDLDFWEQYKKFNLHVPSKPVLQPEDTSSQQPMVPPPIDPLPSRVDVYADPTTWPCFYKECRGKQQSPININTESIQTNGMFGPLKLSNYSKPLSNLVIHNVGFTAYISVPAEADCLVTSDWLMDTFRLYRIEFRWSSASDFGSDHTVDGRYYPLEVRLLHLNTKYNESSSEADAYLTLVVFHKLREKDNPALFFITEVFPKIIFPDRNTTLKESLKLHTLLPKKLDSYVTYNGSRIYTPCSENYRYIIFDYAKPISEAQLGEFRRLRRILPGENSNDDIEIGTRPVQPLLNRVVQGSMSSSEIKPKPSLKWSR